MPRHRGRSGKGLPATCYGCGTCAGMCPSGAIVMRPNRNEVFTPVVDAALCLSCGTCITVCPYVNPVAMRANVECRGEACKKTESAIIGSYAECYRGWASDQKLRHGASSGGLVTALLVGLLQRADIDAAIVVSSSQRDWLRPTAMVARSEEEVLAAMGSKYVPVPVNEVLRVVRNTPGRYAMVGLPCHLQGVRLAESLDATIRERVVLLLGLFCSGTSSLRATPLLLDAIELRGCRVSSIHFRGEGWPGSFRVSACGGAKSREIPYDKYWDVIRTYLSVGCLGCWDALAESADVSFGDAWTDRHRLGAEDGVSIAVARTGPGIAALYAAMKKGAVILEVIDAGEVERGQLAAVEFKKRHMALRDLLLRVAGGRGPERKGVRQLGGFRPVSFLRTLLLFARCLVASSALGRKAIDGVGLRYLRSRVETRGGEES